MPQETSYIIVMGATGSGKSTFINLVSGSTLDVSDGLRSCTSDVQESRPFTLDDQNVVLVDTPGFDDTSRSDMDIITTISTHLANMHRQGARLAGIIYMHRISDVRVGGTSLLNFRIFCKLCGKDNLRNAVILTTMWSRVDPELGESREHELAAGEDLFKPAFDSGAQLVRHDGTSECARDVLRRLLANKSATLRIQTELVDERRELINTAAGAELARLFGEQIRRLRMRNQKLIKQMKEASLAQDEAGTAALRSEIDQIQKQKQRVEDEDRRLRQVIPALGFAEPIGGNEQPQSDATSQAFRDPVHQERPDELLGTEEWGIVDEQPPSNATSHAPLKQGTRQDAAIKYQKKPKLWKRFLLACLCMSP